MTSNPDGPMRLAVSARPRTCAPGIPPDFDAAPCRPWNLSPRPFSRKPFSRIISMNEDSASVRSEAPAAAGVAGTGQPPQPRAVFWTVFPSIMLPMFLAVADQTIVATALPAIASDLGDVERVSWVLVSY